jgi:hypothetical protein
MTEPKRYDLDVGKRRVRRRWREFIKRKIFDRKKQNILCFPGEYGFEIEQCYRPLGFREENIHGVERDKRAARLIRERYPKISLYEGELMAFANEYNGPPFSIVSLDYCGHFSNDKMNPLALLSARGLLAERCVIAVNLMAGREQTEDQQSLRNLYTRVLQDQRDLKGKVVDIREAIALLNEANDENITEVRDNAVTQALLSLLGYFLPSMQVSFGFDLTKLRGVAVALRHDTKVLEPAEDGATRLENAEVMDGSNRMSLSLQIKHEAIQDINDELRSRGIIATAKLEARRLGIPPEFFDYHLGRTLVMAFYDKHGQPDFPVTLERYSYVSESGRRMVSDFVETRSFRHELASLPDVIAPLHGKQDPATHRFCLHPDPEGEKYKGRADAYLDLLKRVVKGYAEKIAKNIKSEPDTWPEREDLGGGETMGVDEEKLKARVIELIKKGRTTEEIVQKVPYLQPGTVRAIRAHVTMHTYDKKSGS